MATFAFDFDEDDGAADSMPTDSQTEHNLSGADRCPTSGTLTDVGPADVAEQAIALVSVPLSQPPFMPSHASMLVADADSAMKAGVTSSDSWGQSLGTSDIVPGTYEGGFRVWSGAPLLASVILSFPTLVQDAHVLELGCGHALPSAASLLAGAAAVTCQDLNDAVLRSATAATLVANISAPSQHPSRTSFPALPPLSALLKPSDASNPVSSSIAESSLPSAPSAAVNAGRIHASAVGDPPTLLGALRGAGVRSALSQLSSCARLLAGPWCGVTAQSTAFPFPGGLRRGVDVVVGSDVAYTDAHALAVVRASLSALGVGRGALPGTQQFGSAMGKMGEGGEGEARAGAEGEGEVVWKGERWCVIIVTKSFYFGTGGGSKALLESFVKECGAVVVGRGNGGPTGVDHVSEREDGVVGIADLLHQSATSPSPLVSVVWHGGRLAEDIVVAVGRRGQPR